MSSVHAQLYRPQHRLIWFGLGARYIRQNARNEPRGGEKVRFLWIFENLQFSREIYVFMKHYFRWPSKNKGVLTFHLNMCFVTAEIEANQLL